VPPGFQIRMKVIAVCQNQFTLVYGKNIHSGLFLFSAFLFHAVPIFANANGIEISITTDTPVYNESDIIHIAVSIHNLS